jgi:hypothetical protein
MPWSHITADQVPVEGTLPYRDIHTGLGERWLSCSRQRSGRLTALDWVVEASEQRRRFELLTTPKLSQAAPPPRAVWAPPHEGLSGSHGPEMPDERRVAARGSAESKAAGSPLGVQLRDGGGTALARASYIWR